MALVLASSQNPVNPGAATLSTTAITVVDGDVLVVKASSEDQATCSINLPTAPGQTFTVRAADTTTSYCAAQIATCVVTGSPGTLIVTQTFSAAKHVAMVVERWTGAALAATPATNGTKLATSLGGLTGSITTTGTNSAVTWVATDWSANAPGTIAYRSSATQDGLDDRSTAFYVGYFATQTAAAAGAQTFGTTTPAASAKWKYLAIEVQTAGSAPVAVAPMKNDSVRTAIRRAANW